MAFSKTSFVAGPLLSATVQTNLKGMQDYINGGVATGDLKTSATWCDTQQIMKPSYEATSNTLSMVTGFQGGKFRSVPRDLMTMITRYNTARTNAASLTFADALFNFVGNTAVEVRVPRNAKFLLVQYTVNPQTPWFEVAQAKQSQYELYVSTAPLTLNQINGGLGVKGPSASYTWIERSDATALVPAQGPLPMSLARKAGSGFWMLDAPAADVYYLGMIGKTDCPYTIFLNWTVSVEVWI